MKKEVLVRYGLTLTYILLKNDLTYFKNLHTAIFLKYVWPLFNIMNKKVKST